MAFSAVAIKRAVDRQIARFRRASRPVRHSWELSLSTLLRPGFQFPLQPWRLAETAAQAESVASLAGAFEPRRRVRIFGDAGVKIVGQQRQRNGSLGVRLLRDVIVLPCHVILSRQRRRILPASFDLPTNGGDHILKPAARGGYFYQPLRRLKAPMAVAEPLFLADTIHKSYGHQLLELAPKMLVREALPSKPIVATTHEPMADLVSPFGVDAGDVVRIDRPLFCSAVYVPDPPFDLSGNVHTIARTAFERLAQLAASSAIEPAERIFVSRLQWPGRVMANEAEAHELFRRYGFEIVVPEALPVPDQIKLFASARMVAGPGGSAMHNLVFSPPSTKALFLTSPRWFVAIDSFIAKADDQFGFVIGTELPSPPKTHDQARPFRVDLTLAEDAIHQHFGL